MPFGTKKQCDFVFREPHNHYVLVEIEKPRKQLFRKDGQRDRRPLHARRAVAFPAAIFAGLSKASDWRSEVSAMSVKLIVEMSDRMLCDCRSRTR